MLFPPPLDSLAQAQYGLLTRAQILGVLSRSQLHRRLRAGLLVPVGRGVYRLAGSPVTWRQRALAACLAIGDPVAVSHRAAGYAWRVASLAAPRRSRCPSRRVEVPGLAMWSCTAGRYRRSTSSADGISLSRRRRARSSICPRCSPAPCWHGWRTTCSVAASWTSPSSRPDWEPTSRCRGFGAMSSRTSCAAAATGASVRPRRRTGSSTRWSGPVSRHRPVTIDRWWEAPCGSWTAPTRNFASGSITTGGLFIGTWRTFTATANRQAAFQLEGWILFQVTLAWTADQLIARVSAAIDQRSAGMARPSGRMIP